MIAQGLRRRSAKNVDLRYVASVIAVTLLYYVSARFGFSLAFETKQVTAVWPPSGIALVALWSLGYRAWPGILVGAFLVNAGTGEPLLTAALIACGNTLGPLLGVYLLRRVAKFDPGFTRIRDVLGLLFFGAVLSMGLTASNGVLNLAANDIIPWSSAKRLWVLWWIGDAMGVLLFAPALFTWLKAPRLGLTAKQSLELLALFFGLFVVTYLIFAYGEFQGKYVVFPFLIWAALRFGQREVATCNLAIAGIAVWHTIQLYGSFAGANPDQRLVLLDTFLAIASVTGLILGAITAERKRVQQECDVLLGQLETAKTSLEERLLEREVLLQEIHHRVKNNLQVISSLLNIQMSHLKAGPSRDALEECQKRMHAIALIHEKLYSAKSYTHISFAEYARGLAEDIFHATEDVSSRIKLELNIDNTSLAVGRAIPCGLIMNELMTNALKHAFPNGRSGKIRVSLREASSESLELAISDDGVGLPASLDVQTLDSLGLRLVEILSKQLNASLTIETPTGTSFRIVFPKESQS